MTHQPSTFAQSLVNLDNVSYIRKEQYLLSNITWSVFPQQHTVLFGPNGAGKTTLLRIITGYLYPSRGSAQILGETVGHTNLPELRKKIGWVSSALDPFLHEEDPALEIVVAGKFAATRLFEKAEENDFLYAKELLKSLNANSIQDRQFGQLSQGEQRKVLIARSLINQPPLLILDEPCTGLDLVAREEFLQDLVNLVSRSLSTTIIYVTHHVEEILPFFRNIILLKNGKCLKSGSISEYLTSENLSDLFGKSISLSFENKRYSAHLDRIRII